MNSRSNPAQPEAQPVLSVTQLNRLARSLLEDNFPALMVEGEISNFSSPSSGHWYLTLKDEQAQIRCAMFRNRNLYVRFRPKDGLKVTVKAKLSLYEARGDYQLIIEYMEESGAGNLQREFEQLKNRLQQEGLFNPDRKRSLPVLPRHIAVVTSPTGAAIRDVISVLKRRFPAIPVTVVPVPVQGQEAPQALIRALALVNQRSGCLQDVDVILLCRGGGSLEDLWAFNDENLARAIYSSTLPVICAVGHEVDFTIADFVADLRAPTPSAAAELLSPNHSEMHKLFSQRAGTLASVMRNQLQRQGTHLIQLGKRLRHPGQRLQQQAQQLDDLELRYRRAIRMYLQRCRQQLDQNLARLKASSPRTLLHQGQVNLKYLREKLGQHFHNRLHSRQQSLQEMSHALNTVSPLATLDRGYALTTTAQGAVLQSYKQVQPGDTIHTLLAQGRISSTVTETTADSAVDPTHR